MPTEVIFFDADPNRKTVAKMTIQEEKFTVLIPEEFKDMTGQYTVFEYVAMWNKDHLTPEMLSLKKPYPENFRGMDRELIKMYKKAGKTDAQIQQLDMEIRREFYDKALKEYEKAAAMIRDVRILSDTEMTEKYGKNYLHEIGVSIYRSDRLVYPIKLSYDPELRYEDAEPSAITW